VKLHQHQEGITVSIEGWVVVTGITVCEGYGISLVMKEAGSSGWLSAAQASHHQSDKALDTQLPIVPVMTAQ
jgi:hypothetical protein